MPFLCVCVCVCIVLRTLSEIKVQKLSLGWCHKQSKEKQVSSKQRIYWQVELREVRGAGEWLVW